FSRSELDVQADPTAMLTDARAKLAAVGEAEGRLGCNGEVHACFHDRSVLRNRRTGNGESFAGLEAMVADRVNVAKRMLPANRSACLDLVACYVKIARCMQTDGHERGVHGAGGGAERCVATRFAEAIGVETNVGQVCEGLDGRAANVHLVTDLTEGVERTGIVISGERVGEATESYGTVRLDAGPGV